MENQSIKNRLCRVIEYFLIGAFPKENDLGNIEILVFMFQALMVFSVYLNVYYRR